MRAAAAKLAVGCSEVVYLVAVMQALKMEVRLGTAQQAVAIAAARAGQVGAAMTVGEEGGAAARLARGAVAQMVAQVAPPRWYPRHSVSCLRRSLPSQRLRMPIAVTQRSHCPATRARTCCWSCR